MHRNSVKGTLRSPRPTILHRLYRENQRSHRTLSAVLGKHLLGVSEAFYLQGNQTGELEEPCQLSRSMAFVVEKQSVV